MLSAAYVAATTAFLDVLNVFATTPVGDFGLVYGDIELEGGPPLTLSDFDEAQAARTAYIAALTSSLEFIDGLQRQRISHYRPAYLAGAHQLLADVTNDALVIGQGGAAVLAQRVEAYGSLYNDGNFNYVRSLRDREVFGLRRRFYTALLKKVDSAEKMGPNPIPDSNVWVHLPVHGSIVLADPAARSATVRAIGLRLYPDKSAPGSVKAVILNRSGDQLTVVSNADLPVDYKRFDEQLVQPSDKLNIAAGQYLGICNLGPEQLFLNWVDGTGHQVWWPSINPKVGTTSASGGPISVVSCGWWALLH